MTDDKAGRIKKPAPASPSQTNAQTSPSSHPSPTPPPLPSVPSPHTGTQTKPPNAPSPHSPSPSQNLLALFSDTNFPSLRIEDTKPLQSIQVIRDEKKDLFAIHVMPPGQKQLNESAPETHWHFVQVEGKGEDGLYPSPGKPWLLFRWSLLGCDG